MSDKDDWTNQYSWVLEDPSPLYEPENPNQPTIDSPQLKPLQPSHHPHLDHASPWSYHSPSPGPMITSSQHASPRLSPRSTVGASPRISEWAPSPELMITTSQAASPALIPHHAHNPSLDGGLSRLRFSHQPPAHKTMRTSSLVGRGAIFIHPEDLRVRATRKMPNLSREILTEIFLHYADNGVSNDFAGRGSLAALLLVSRHWHNVAMQTPYLWERFDIRINQFHDFEIWKRLAKQRITRLKKDPCVFISITVHVPAYTPAVYGPVDETARLAVSCLRELASLVAELAGDSNALASSWRRFSIILPSRRNSLIPKFSDSLYSDAGRYMGEMLGREMNRLEHMELQGLQWPHPQSSTVDSSNHSSTFHSNTNSLQVVRLRDCILPCTPGIRHVRELRVEDCEFLNDQPFGPVHIAGLTTSEAVSHTSIQGLRIDPPSHLSSLHTLAFGPLCDLVTLDAASLRVLEVVYRPNHRRPCLPSLFYISRIAAGGIERLQFLPSSEVGPSFLTIPGNFTSEEIKTSIVSFFGNNRRIKEIRGPIELLLLVLTSLYELRQSSVAVGTLFDGLIMKLDHNFARSTREIACLAGDEDITALQEVAWRHFKRTLPFWPTS